MKFNFGKEYDIKPVEELNLPDFYYAYFKHRYKDDYFTIYEGDFVFLKAKERFSPITRDFPYDYTDMFFRGHRVYDGYPGVNGITRHCELLNDEQISFVEKTFRRRDKLASIKDTTRLSLAWLFNIAGIIIFLSGLTLEQFGFACLVFLFVAIGTIILFKESQSSN